jgi:hypothetical protein
MINCEKFNMDPVDPKRKKHQLTEELMFALDTLYFAHGMERKDFCAMCNWILVTHFDFIEISLLQEAIQWLPNLESEKRDNKNPYLHLLDSLRIACGLEASFESHLALLAKRQKENKKFPKHDPRTLCSLNNLSVTKRDKLIDEYFTR